LPSPRFAPEKVIIEQKRSSGGVFWGLFHFFITLPIVLVVGGLFFLMCVGSMGSP
jgi:hypothetical protein